MANDVEKLRIVRKRGHVPLPNVPAPVDGVPFEDLEPMSCRWPLGDLHAPAVMFCGAEKLLGCSYCRSHRAAAYSRTQRQITAAKLAEAA